jgi:hypothetical protein
MICVPSDDMSPDDRRQLFWFCDVSGCGLTMGVLETGAHIKDAPATTSFFPARVRSLCGGGALLALHKALGSLSLSIEQERPWGNVSPLTISIDGDIWIENLCAHATPHPFHLAAQRLAQMPGLQRSAEGLFKAARADAAPIREAWALVQNGQARRKDLERRVQSSLLCK